MGLALAFAAAAALNLPFTTTAEIKVDGKIYGPEWSDAKKISLGEGVTVLIKCDDDNIAIAVKGSAARGPQFADLYIAAGDGSMVNLRASTDVGERKLEGTAWTDSDPVVPPGNNLRWQANAIELKANAADDAPMAKRVKPYDGQEFLLSRVRFTGNSFKLRVEVRDLAAEKPDLVAPKESDRYDTTGWTTLTLP